MHKVALEQPHDLAAFRCMARQLIAAGVTPRQVMWLADGEDGLFDAPYLPDGEPLRVPAAFVRLAEDVICHRNPARLGLLYAALWRIAAGDRVLVSDPADPLMHQLLALQKDVRRDIHKAHAFVRFRRVEDADGERYVAWFEPDHFILERLALFFADRFTAMRWSILTPIGAIHWDGETLTQGPAVAKNAAPGADGLEDWWRTYYRATFNPSRSNPRMMRAEMPTRYWRNLPEAEIIHDMLAEAPRRSAAMLEAKPTMPRKRMPEPREGLFEEPLSPGLELPAVDPDTTVATLRQEAAGCTRCPLYKHATQTVFGEGPADARVVMVGEQPGDQEDLQGRPFVGPAGKLLDRALAEAGIERGEVYLTNAVKHFKFEPRGKRRLHKAPDRPEIEACRWWLERELKVVRPQLVVALGGTAGSALYGRPVKVLSERGRISDDPRGFRLMLTVHPSMILRVPNEAKEQAYADFLRDLKMAA